MSVRTSGAGAYAFYADSYSAASGQDSQGTVAAIRSYDSATGLPVIDKVYRVTGDMLATRSGVIDLRMGNASRYTGATTITDNGVLNLAIAGGDSVWRMTRDSSLSAVTLSSGATLALADAAAPVNALTLRGTVLNQGGLIDAAGGRGTAGNRLTIIGDYAGQAGTVLLRTVLGGDDSLTDRLVIDGGAATGDTGLLILNTGGAGAQTQQGIPAWCRPSTARAPPPTPFIWTQGPRAIAPGTGTLAAGGYDYSLVRGGGGGVESDWYLTSQATPQPPCTASRSTAGPAPVQPPVQPPHTDPPEAGDRNVSPESGAYAANQRAGMTLFSHSLHDRQPVPVDANASDHRRMLWTRAVGRRDHGLRMAEGRVSIDGDSYVMQIGGDLLHAQAGHDGAVASA